MPRQAPGPQDGCIKPGETCGVLLLLLHQQQPTADVTCKSFWAAWNQQAVILLSWLTGPSMLSRTPGSWFHDQNKSANFAWISHRKNALRSQCSHRSATLWNPCLPWQKHTPISLATRLHLAVTENSPLYVPQWTASISLQFTLAEEALKWVLRQFSTAPVSCSSLTGTVRSFVQEERHTGLVLQLYL